jgi:hypothetical protein
MRTTETARRKAILERAGERALGATTATSGIDRTYCTAAATASLCVFPKEHTEGALGS